MKYILISIIVMCIALLTSMCYLPDKYLYDLVSIIIVLAIVVVIYSVVIVVKDYREDLRDEHSKLMKK